MRRSSRPALKIFSPTQRALGDEGPSDLLKARLGGAQTVSVDVGFTPGEGLDARLVTDEDLTPLHQNDDYKPDPFIGAAVPISFGPKSIGSLPPSSPSDGSMVRQ